MHPASSTPRRGLSLGTRFIAGAILLLAVAVGASAFFNYRVIDSMARSQAASRRADGLSAIENRAELIAHNLSSAIAQPLAESLYDYAAELAEKTAAENALVEWIVLVDEQSGTILASTKAAPKDAHKTEFDTALAAEPRPTAVLKAPSPSSANRILLASNVFVGRTVAARLVMQVQTADLEAAVAAQVAEAQASARRATIEQLVVAAIILLLGIALASWQVVRVVRPLKELTLQAGRIAAGDFGHRVHVASSDEVGALGHSFNSMAESLGRVLHEMAGKAQLEREVEVARSIQTMMSPPPTLHNVGSFAISGRCIMADQCGGDWWSFRELRGGRLLLVVGDVTGHGMPSAMIAATARGAVEALSFIDESALTPELVLETIDEAIRDVGNRKLLMTCFACVLDPLRGTIHFANAGHGFPYRIRPTDGGDADLVVLAARGNPLGSQKRCIRTAERDLRPGDLLVLTTDGVGDRVGPSGDRFGERRLRKIVTNGVGQFGAGIADELCERILQELTVFGSSSPLDDDLTLIICKYARPAASQPTRHNATLVGLG